ncbi:MAG TPA: nucleotidyltransferase domain-containing protein [Sphingomicrobium sp.]|jgi:predicted nucleotidyltransferase|nr:nucleotidyltransferase domain-containing protein [Sphingomicrobium sp.]
MTRDWIEKATFLRCEVGSGIHGIAEAGKDDRDEMGVCLEPYELAQGIKETFEQHIYRTAAVREQQHDAPSQPGDLDLTIYSLRKWIRLALKGNPTVITLLFSPSYIVCNARGQSLLELAPCFASRTAGAHYLGYLQAQRQRLLGERGQKNVNRRELVEAYGFDTKYAGHMLRLGYQGVEFMETGRLTLPMPEVERERVRAVRRGEVSLNDVLTETGYLEVRLRDLYTTSPLPERPNTTRVEEWMLDTYYESWKATYGHAKEIRMNRMH